MVLALSRLTHIGEMQCCGSPQYQADCHKKEKGDDYKKLNFRAKAQEFRLDFLSCKHVRFPGRHISKDNLKTEVISHPQRDELAFMPLLKFCCFQ